MKTHNFENSLVVGQAGEKIILDYLANNKNITQTIDVSNDVAYQNKDIDFIVTFSNGKTGTVELKTDTYTSGNIFFETMSAVETNSLGCMLKSEADYLFYYFVKSKELYILSLKKYREWFFVNQSRFNKKTFKNSRWNGGTYTSEGYTIPKTFLESNFKGYVKYILTEDGE